MSRTSKTRPHRFKPQSRLTVGWAQKVENFVSTFSVLSGGQFWFDGETANLQVFTGSRWSGVVWFGNTIIKDYTRVSGNPAGDLDPNWITNNVTGKYLGVNLTTGACSFADDVGDFDETSTQAFWVADRSGDPGDYTYTLNQHTQGDVHGRIT